MLILLTSFRSFHEQMSLRSLVFALLRCKEYDHEADIYSFGIMLWEMWYGKKVLFEEEEHVSDQESKGARPLYVQGVIKPPTDWQDLMLLYWDGKPCNRPDAAVSQAIGCALPGSLRTTSMNTGC